MKFFIITIGVCCSILGLSSCVMAIIAEDETVSFVVRTIGNVNFQNVRGMLFLTGMFLFFTSSAFFQYADLICPNCGKHMAIISQNIGYRNPEPNDCGSTLGYHKIKKNCQFCHYEKYEEERDIDHWHGE